MDAKLKAKWIKALRGGKFKQTTGSLYDGFAYCCLGVLATIQGCDIEKAIPDQDDRVTEHLPRGFNAGLSPAQRAGLASRNDGCHDSYEGKTNPRHSFGEIADYIEKNL